jgi:hypothetical protein
MAVNIVLMRLRRKRIAKISLDPRDSMPLRPFEIHEQMWFPQFFRDQVVDGPQTILDIMNTCEPIAQLLHGPFAR